ncbi:MAG: hypothetical protein CMQ05_00985 [Gammaproteobacteria bacterium]|nr:hypothetical protein [Gammaproteobacteria bacterium]RPG25660.1 MAG: LysR family transcriptional regulator [Gammaproteobacteria bacterium TMED50]
MHSLVDLKRMRYIVEVAKAEAITTAAEILAISQPALTRNIAEVESELGVQLFHRMPRGIQLTDEGTRFVSRAKQILGDVDNLLTEMQEESDLLTGRLKIGFVPSGYAHHVRDALTHMVDQYPGISIETVSGNLQTICPRLLHGELNLVVGSNRYLERWRELQITRVKRMHFACMCRAGHPLAGKNNIQELDVLSYPAILTPTIETTASDLAQRYIANKLPEFQPRYVTDDDQLIQRLLDKTNAYSPIQFPVPIPGGVQGNRLFLTDVIDLPDHYISIATSPYRPMTKLAERFIELVNAQWERLGSE